MNPLLRPIAAAAKSTMPTLSSVDDATISNDRVDASSTPIVIESRGSSPRARNGARPPSASTMNPIAPITARFFTSRVSETKIGTTDSTVPSTKLIMKVAGAT